jgi:opacity protein-like surface antigen
MKKFPTFVVSALAASVALALPAVAANKAAQPVVQEAPLRAHLAFLSSDLLEGRGTGQRHAGRQGGDYEGREFFHGFS